jgi:uncharacterized membrane protein YdbT with pleckstrin-like domain
MSSYIEESLGAGEVVIARARFHWLYNLSAWLSVGLPLIAELALYAEASNQPPVDSSNPYYWGMILVGLWLLWGLFTCIKMLVLKNTTEIGVTSHRFVEKHGVFSMKTSEIALPNIEGVKVNQTFTGRIFGYGKVTIEGTGVDNTTTPDIADPVGFVRAIQTAKEHVAGLTATPRPDAHD